MSENVTMNEPKAGEFDVISLDFGLPPYGVVFSSKVRLRTLEGVGMHLQSFAENK